MPRRIKPSEFRQGQKTFFSWEQLLIDRGFGVIPDDAVEDGPADRGSGINGDRTGTERPDCVSVGKKDICTFQMAGLGNFFIHTANEAGIDFIDGIHRRSKRYPTDFIEYGKVKKTLHPTQKPVPLLEYLVKTYTNEGDTVLDNCMGSGSTAVACVNTNRKYIGFEISKEYCGIANQRIAEVAI